jgi:prolyl oligopeptidase
MKDAMTDTASAVTETMSDAISDYVPVTYDRAGQTDADHLYLEEVEGEAALAEVEAWNTRSLERLKSDPRYQTLYTDALNILQSEDRIQYATIRGNFAYNFWQDETNVRGLWRRAPLDAYLAGSPDWDTVLDLDALSEAEGKNWVYKGVSCLGPDYEHCVINLSDGGKDAVVRREFNTVSKTFVDDGFMAPESKGTLSWVDEDHVLIGVDFGQQDYDGVAASSLTDSGYPREARLWKRGTALSDAPRIGYGPASDVGYWPFVLELSDGRREIMVQRSKTFYDKEIHWFPRNGDDLADPVKLPLPEKVDLIGEFKGQILVALNEDWRGNTTGSLVSFGIDDFMEDGEIGTVTQVYVPDARSSLNGYGITKSKVLVGTTTDVKGAVHLYDFDGESWSSQRVNLPENGAASVGATNSDSDIAFLQAEDFLTPDTLYVLDTSTGSLDPKAMQSLPDWFDASSMVSEQFFATSKDGTKVPYFVVRNKDIELDGTNPTLLYGYGGFEIPLNPAYSATRGKLWLENGGVYVLSNIRGGGEYGPKWHQAGLKTERQRIYDDFIAVAESLIEKGITSPEHLGVEGGSNGGLLTGVMTTQRPDLINAAIIAVPLLDMERFHLLLAGASWMGEYGDPDKPVEGAFLRQISPYHNLREDVDYPEVFLVTSTKDDRVHPGHARKFAKRMEDQGHDFLYYENIDGGHSAAANLKETANRLALQHVYLMQKLADSDPS